MAKVKTNRELRASEDVGPSSWWVCTDSLRRGGKKIIGPFDTRELALEVRQYVEQVRGTTYWVDQEGA